MLSRRFAHFEGRFSVYQGEPHGGGISGPASGGPAFAVGDIIDLPLWPSLDLVERKHGDIRALARRNLAAIGEAEVSSEYSCLGVHGFFETE